MQVTTDRLQVFAQSLQPWKEFFKYESFSAPATKEAAMARLKFNVPFYRVNYAVAVATACAASLLTSPAALLGFLAIVALLLHTSATPMTQQRAAGTLAATVLLLLWSDAVAVLCGGALAGAALCGVHGALRHPEDLFMEV